MSEFDAMSRDELLSLAKQQAEQLRTQEEAEGARREEAKQNSELMRQQALADASRMAGSGSGSSTSGTAEYAQGRYRKKIVARVPLDRARAEFISDMITGPPADDGTP